LPELKAGKMKKPFDLFWFGDSGPNWIETVETLEKFPT
jgi:hypothetical protein